MILKPRECKGCTSFTQFPGFLPVGGKGTYNVLLVAESPSRTEVEAEDSLHPYSERNTIIKRACASKGLDMTAFWHTNLLQCTSHGGNGAKAHCYQAHLSRRITELNPRLIVAMGERVIAELTGLSGKKASANHVRGFIVPGIGPASGYMVKLVHDPKYIKEGNMHLLGVFAEDLAKSLTDTKKEFRPAYKYGLGYLKALYEELLANPELPFGFDIETNFSLTKDEDEVREHEDRITQIQFSAHAGTASIMPWFDGARPLVQAIMDLPNPRLSWNGYAFDVPRLERDGIRCADNAIHHDLMWMWHHLQPDLPMNLSFATGSMIGDQVPPWKHTMSEDIVRYGGLDVDVLVRLYQPLVEALQAEGLYEGYETYVQGLWPVLSAMSKRGLPIDPAGREEFREWLRTEAIAIDETIQATVPKVLRDCHPKDGYKAPPRAKPGAFEHREDGSIWAWDKERLEWTQLVLRPFGEDKVARFCRLKPFLVNSPVQIKRYCEYMGYKIPKTRKGRAWKESLSKDILKEMSEKYDDPLFKSIVQLRELDKIQETYVDGWKLSDKNAIHTTFHFGPASGQLGSREPNIQNIPKWGPLAKRLRTLVKAPDDHMLVEVDMTAFHAKTLGFCAADAGYMRIAGLDIHSYVAAHILGLPEADKILDMADDEAMDYLGWVKKEHNFVRNKQAKPAILGIGFGMGVNKLYMLNQQYFKSKEEAQHIHDMLKSLFPKIFSWQTATRQEAADRGRLITPFGCVRRFYDVFKFNYVTGTWELGNDGEACIAFPPSNIAHMHIRGAMLALHAKGLDERYQMINMVHDSLMFMPHKSLVDECVSTVVETMQYKSPILIHPEVAPDGFSVAAEASVGKDWTSMEVYR